MDGNCGESLEERQDRDNAETSGKIPEKVLEIIVLLRGRNCAKTIDRCLNSLKKQTYPHWKAMIVLDAPRDNSNIVANSHAYEDDRFRLLVSSEHLGVCHNMHNIIQVAGRILRPEDEDVAVVVDLDDRLPKDAFETVVKRYVAKPETLITHGSYVKMTKGRRTKISKAYPKHGKIRSLPWRGSHLKTFKWKIVKQAKPEWFQHKGEWLNAASDLALMFGCIEIAGLKHVEYIHKITYHWFNKITAEKIASQKRCEKILRKK